MIRHGLDGNMTWLHGRFKKKQMQITDLLRRICVLAVTTFWKVQSMNLFSVDFSPTGRGRNKLQITALYIECAWYITGYFQSCKVWNLLRMNNATIESFFLQKHCLWNGFRKKLADYYHHYIIEVLPNSKNCIFQKSLCLWCVESESNKKCSQYTK